MKQIKINEKEISIITSIDEITIDKFEKILLSKKNNELKLDEFIENLQILSDITLEEIEEMDLNEFQELMKSIKLESFEGFESSNIIEIEIDGIKYRAKATGDAYKFNVKEMFLLSDYIKNSPDKYISYLSSIIFKQVGDDNLIINDLTPESISARQAKFESKITMNIITPYLIKLSEYYQIK